MQRWLGRLFGRPAPLQASPPPERPQQPPLTSMEDLDALISRCGLTAARDLIRASAVPCFHIIAGPPAAEAPLGATRLGGAPDLPAGQDWPKGGAGLLSFLGQLDLADIRARTGSTELPPEGLLSIFVEDAGCASDPVAIQAVLTPPGVALARLARPMEGDFGGHPGWLEPVEIAAFSPGVNAPSFDGRLYGQIADLAPEGDLDAFLDGLWLRPPGTIGQLFGDGRDHDGTDLRLGIHARAIGRPGLQRYGFVESWDHWQSLKTIENRLANGTIHRPWNSREDADVRWLLDNREAFEAGARRMRLLLMVDSNRPMNLWINDADPIYVFADAEALARGDVSRLEGAVTQG